MPEVLEVRPKGVYIKIEFSLEEIEILKEAMDRCTIDVDMKDEKEKMIQQYFVENFYAFISQIVKDLANGT